MHLNRKLPREVCKITFDHPHRKPQLQIGHVHETSTPSTFQTQIYTGIALDVKHIHAIKQMWSNELGASTYLLPPTHHATELLKSK